MIELFYFNAWQNYWVRLPPEVRDFMNSIPQVQALNNQENRVVPIRLLKQEMSHKEVDDLPKVF
jgi:hypothetical protein